MPGPRPALLLLGASLHASTYAALRPPPCAAPLVTYVHVGPHKTSSSFVQSHLVSRASPSPLRTTLEHTDRVVVPTLAENSGPKAHARFAWALEHGPLNLSDPVVSQFDAQLRQAARTLPPSLCGMLISSEDLARPVVNVSALFALMRPHGARVRVIVVYRRLYEWFVSKHNENYKPAGSRTAHLRLGERAALYSRLVDWLSSDASARAESTWTAAVMERYAVHAGWDEVRILNMHDARRGSVLDQLLCEQLPARAACARARNSSTGHAASARTSCLINRSYNLTLFDVLMAVVARGDVRRELRDGATADLALRALTHGQLRVAVRKRQPLPRECLNESATEALRARSEHYEARLLPDWHDAAAFSRAFEEARVARRLFCSVDTRALHDGASAEYAHWQHLASRAAKLALDRGRVQQSEPTMA